MSQPQLFEDDFDIETESPGIPVFTAEGSWNYNHVLVGVVVGGLIVATWFIAGSTFGGRGVVTHTGATEGQFESSAQVVMDRTGNSAGSSWESIRKRLADQSVVPTRTPLGFYVVLFVVVAIAVLAVGLVIKVLKSTAFWTAIVVALIIVVVLAWHSGKFKEARQGHLKATQTTGASSR